MAAAVAAEFARPTRRVEALIGGKRVRHRAGPSSRSTRQTPIRSWPRRPRAGPPRSNRHFMSATSAAESWSRVPAAERAAVLFGAADRMRRARNDLAALEVREAGKGWADADADVCEAIDYCEYYARRMLELDGGGAVQSPPGEENRLLYHGQGSRAVISPWNFPLAIPAGMTCAALVTGNAVVLKPAEQTPAVAAELVSALARVRTATTRFSRSCPGTGLTRAHRSSATRWWTSSPSPARATSVSASSRQRRRRHEGAALHRARHRRARREERDRRRQ